MAPRHLFVLHGPFHERLKEGGGLPKLDERLTVALAPHGVQLRSARAADEGQAAAALLGAEGWATHLLLAPGALGPSSHLLVQAVALLDVPYAEVYAEALPGAAAQRRASLLRTGASDSRVGDFPGAWAEAAGALLGLKLELDSSTSTPVASPAVAPPKPTAVAAPEQEEGSDEEQEESTEGSHEPLAPAPRRPGIGRKVLPRPTPIAPNASVARPAEARPPSASPTRLAPRGLAPALQGRGMAPRSLGPRPTEGGVGGALPPRSLGRSGPSPTTTSPAQATTAAFDPNVVTRAQVKAKVGARLAGRATTPELAAWAREQWMKVERGGAIEPGQKELLGEALQNLTLAGVSPLYGSEAALLDLMSRLG